MSIQGAAQDLSAGQYKVLAIQSYTSSEDTNQHSTSYFDREPLTIEKMRSLLNNERHWHQQQTNTIISSFRTTCEELCKYLQNFVCNAIKDSKEELLGRLPDSVADAVSFIVTKPQRLTPKNTLQPSSQTPSDDAIISRWKQIAYSVENLTNKVLECECRMPNEWQGNAPNDKLDSGLNTTLLDDETSTHESIQLFIWKCVADLVFNGDADVWFQSSTMSWIRARSELIGETRLKEGDISKVTAWMAQMPGLEQLEGSAEKIHHIADYHSRKLVQFLKCPPPLLLEVLTKDFKEIINDSVKLEAIFVASKAIFEVDWMVRGGDLAFNKSEMELASPYKEIPDEAKVLYIFRPLLRKIGNVDGKFYDSSQVLVKAGAVCQVDGESYTRGSRPSPFIVDD